MALADDPRFSFAFAGGGPRWKALGNVCRYFRISNIAFEPHMGASALSERLASCDIGLVTQCATLGSVDSTRVEALLAAGRPILLIGPRDAATARQIDRLRCGWQIDPGDADALLDLLERLAEQPDLLSALSPNAN